VSAWPIGGLLLLVPVLLLGTPGPAGADPGAALEAEYAAVLAAHTRAVDAIVGTRVDYPAIARDPRWNRVMAALQAVDPGALDGREARLAFWINAYNVLAIQTVLSSHPVESIRDVGSFFAPVWRRRAGSIGGRDYTLHEIEHDVLRPMGDPRIHAAIVCASTSCPSLRREPYTRPRVDAQLDASVRAFLARPEKGMRVDRGADTLWLSRIFDWFEEDFEASGGVIAFVRSYADPATRAWLDARRGEIDVEYLEYDWNLND
jgi:hypothetical protein